MTLAPEPLYLDDPECLLSVFDLRVPGAEEMLGREHAMWQKYTEVEVLDEVHAAVIRRPGWVSEAAA